MICNWYRTKRAPRIFFGAASPLYSGTMAGVRDQTPASIPCTWAYLIERPHRGQQRSDWEFQRVSGLGNATLGERGGPSPTHPKVIWATELMVPVWMATPTVKMQDHIRMDPFLPKRSDVKACARAPLHTQGSRHSYGKLHTGDSKPTQMFCMLWFSIFLADGKRRKRAPG
jgi:hypothetical protein